MAEHAVVGYVHGGTVRAEFLASMLALMRKSATVIDSVIEIGSGPNVSGARNMMARMFLEDQTAPWLWMVDTDMVFAPDALDRLIGAADLAERPIVGALCFSQNPGAGDPFPMMYELVEADGQPVFVHRHEWPQDTCAQVTATSTACLLVHRAVLERVAAVSGDMAAPWFRESVIGSALVGEDLTFCLRAGAAAIPVHVHTGVQAGHMKPGMLGKVL